MRAFASRTSRRDRGHRVRTVPAAGARRPASVCSVSVLPTPLRPSTAMNSPPAALRSRPRTRATRPATATSNGAAAEPRRGQLRSGLQPFVMPWLGLEAAVAGRRDHARPARAVVQAVFALAPEFDDRSPEAIAAPSSRARQPQARLRSSSARSAGSGVPELLRRYLAQALDQLLARGDWARCWLADRGQAGCARGGLRSNRRSRSRAREPRDLRPAIAGRAHPRGTRPRPRGCARGALDPCAIRSWCRNEVAGSATISLHSTMRAGSAVRAPWSRASSHSGCAAPARRSLAEPGGGERHRIGRQGSGRVWKRACIRGMLNRPPVKRRSSACRDETLPTLPRGVRAHMLKQALMAALARPAARRPGVRSGHDPSGPTVPAQAGSGPRLKGIPQRLAIATMGMTWMRPGPRTIAMGDRNRGHGPTTTVATGECDDHGVTTTDAATTGATTDGDRRTTTGGGTTTGAAAAGTMTAERNDGWRYYRGTRQSPLALCRRSTRYGVDFGYRSGYELAWRDWQNYGRYNRNWRRQAFYGFGVGIPIAPATTPAGATPPVY